MEVPGRPSRRYLKARAPRKFGPDPISDMLKDAERQAVIAARFWAKVRIGEPDECWPWLGGRKGDTTADGYGRFKLRSRVQVASSRVAYGLSRGRSPGSWLVLHRCDFPPCCNPAHLFRGSGLNNSADMVAKGRHRNGSRHTAGGRRKLTAESVIDIRARLKGGDRVDALAAEHGVSVHTIIAVRKRQVWRDVDRSDSEPNAP